MAAIFIGSVSGQVVITDTGSTNRAGMTVTVGSKGHTVIESRNGAKAKMTLELDLQHHLLEDVNAAAPLNELPVSHCAKSISFGTRTFVTFKGVKSPDISCPGQTDPRVLALQKDVNLIMAQAHEKVPSIRGPVARFK